MGELEAGEVEGAELVGWYFVEESVVPVGFVVVDVVLVEGLENSSQNQVEYRVGHCIPPDRQLW